MSLGMFNRYGFPKPPKRDIHARIFRSNVGRKKGVNRTPQWKRAEQAASSTAPASTTRLASSIRSAESLALARPRARHGLVIALVASTILIILIGVFGGAVGGFGGNFAFHQSNPGGGLAATLVAALSLALWGLLLARSWKRLELGFAVLLINTAGAIAIQPHGMIMYGGSGSLYVQHIVALLVAMIVLPLGWMLRPKRAGLALPVSLASAPAGGAPGAVAFDPALVDGPAAAARERRQRGPFFGGRVVRWIASSSRSRREHEQTAEVGRTRLFIAVAIAALLIIGVFGAVVVLELRPAELAQLDRAAFEEAKAQAMNKRLSIIDRANGIDAYFKPSPIYGEPRYTDEARSIRESLMAEWDDAVFADVAAAANDPLQPWTRRYNSVRNYLAEPHPYGSPRHADEATALLNRLEQQRHSLPPHPRRRW